MIRTETSAEGPPALATDTTSGPDIAAQCLWEGWSADLSTGLIKAGQIARQRYGLKTEACGFIDLIRCSSPGDRDRILNIFEEASVTSSSFCYSTMVQTGDGDLYPVFCIGKSSVEPGAASGTICGLFAFPHFRLDRKNSASDLSRL